MIAIELATAVFPPLRTSDDGEKALAIMQSYMVRHMPIVNQEQLLGVISEEDILANNPKEAIGSYVLSFDKAFVNKGEHVFQIMSKMAEGHLTLIPVIDAAENYVGAITQTDLLQYFASNFSFVEEGGIIVLETTKSNYSLSEIARIVEDENAVILNSYISSNPHSSKIYITLKINKTDLQHITASLERFKYHVTAFYANPEDRADLQDNYDALMKYLSI